VEQPLPPLRATSGDAVQQDPPAHVSVGEAMLAVPVGFDVAQQSDRAAIESTWDVSQEVQSAREDAPRQAQAQIPQLPQLHVEALQAPPSIASSPQVAMELDPLASGAPPLSVRSSVRSSLASSPVSARSSLSAVAAGPPASSEGLRFGSFAATSSKPPDAHVPSSMGSANNDEEDDDTEETEEEEEAEEKKASNVAGHTPRSPDVNQLVATFATDNGDDDASSSSEEEDDDDDDDTGLLSGLGFADDSPAASGTVQRSVAKASPASTAEDDDDGAEDDADWV